MAAVSPPATPDAPLPVVQRLLGKPGTSAVAPTRSGQSAVGALVAAAAATVAGHIAAPPGQTVRRTAAGGAEPPPPYTPSTASASYAPPPHGRPTASSTPPPPPPPPPEYTEVSEGAFDPRTLTDFQLDELAHRLIGRITRLIRTELRLDRERIGKLRDPRR